MKNLEIFKTFLAALALLLLGFIAQPGSCRDATCKTDATITGKGFCACLPSWEGKCACGVKCNRLKGTYTANSDECVKQTDDSITQYKAYKPSVTCVRSSKNRFTIEGFGGFNTPSLNIACIIQSTTTFIIDDTTFVGNLTTRSIAHTSTGTISASNKLNIDYRVTFSDNTYEDCKLEMTKE